MPSFLYVVRVRISASHFAISEVLLRFCKANFIQEYKNAKLITLKSSEKIVRKITRDTQSSNVHFDC